MDRSTSFIAATAMLLGTATTAQAQFATGIADSRAGNPALGWISIVDDGAARRSGAEAALGVAVPLLARLGPARDPDAVSVDLGDARLEVGAFAGLRGAVPTTGLAWDMGIVYRTPVKGAVAAGLGEDAVGLLGALRYDFGAMVVTASLHYAPHYLASGKSTHYPTLAAEVPIANGFTMSAGISRPWTRSESRFTAPDYTQWSVSGTVNVFGFDVMLSYSKSDAGDAASAAETPGTEALLKLKRAF